MAGRRIDDHGSWIGGGSSASVFPEGIKTRQLKDDEDGGHLSQYEDTEEKIKESQREAKGKMSRHEQEEGYRY